MPNSYRDLVSDFMIAKVAVPGIRRCDEKRMGATNVGVRRAHPYLWSLSSPQQPPETADSPTVSSCPTIYIATRVPCKTVFVKNYEAKNSLLFLVAASFGVMKLIRLAGKNSVIISELRVKFS
jgi:hypothetical protein